LTDWQRSTPSNGSGDWDRDQEVCSLEGTTGGGLKEGNFGRWHRRQGG